MEKSLSVDALVSGGFRYPLVVNLLPGAFALAPFVIALSASNENLSKFFTDFPWAFYTAYMGLSLILGHILEDIGSRIELLIEKPNGSESNWNRYLALKIKDEYIAQRYLRTIVFRLKFELSMIAALAVSLAGVFVLVFAAPHYIAMTTGVLIGVGLLTCIIYRADTPTETPNPRSSPDQSFNRPCEDGPRHPQERARGPEAIQGP